MSYVQILQIVVIVLPLAVALIVEIAKKIGLSATYAPMLVTSIAVAVALGLYWFYPNVEFNTILAAIMAALASGSVYGWKKTCRKL